MSQDHTNDLYSVIPYKIYGLNVMHCKFAITKSTTIAAAAANGDLVGVASVIKTLPSSGLHSVSVAWGPCSRGAARVQGGQ